MIRLPPKPVEDALVADATPAKIEDTLAEARAFWRDFPPPGIKRKPCPFCGKMPRIVNTGRGQPSIECGTTSKLVLDHFVMMVGRSVAEAIARWNRRQETK